MKNPLFVLAIFVGLAGCNSYLPCKVAKSASAKAFVAGHLSWSSRPYPSLDTPAKNGREYDFVCRETGMIVASVTTYDGAVHAWGGDGSAAGDYLTVEAAKVHAESVVNDGKTRGLTWRTCEAKQ